MSIRLFSFMGLILDELYSTENHVTASESPRVHCIHMYDHMLCQVWSVWLRVTVLHKIGVFLLLYTIPHTKPPHRVRPPARMSSGPSGPVAAVQLGNPDWMTHLGRHSGGSLKYASSGAAQVTSGVMTKIQHMSRYFRLCTK